MISAVPALVQRRPSFLSIILSTPDGRRQLGLMVNALLAPAPVHEAFLQGSRALGRQLLS